MRQIEKLQERFLSNIEHEAIEVRGFVSDACVSNFRITKLPEAVKAKLAKLHDLIFGAQDALPDGELGDELSAGLGGTTSSLKKDGRGKDGLLADA